MKITSILFVLSVIALNVFGQDTITYDIRFPNAVHHEAEISIKVPSLTNGRNTIVMSNTSPGRYGIHHFAKNVYRLSAFEEGNEQVKLQRTAPNRWAITGAKEQLSISYTLFANHANGTYSGIDSEFANLNMPATFMWMEGMEENPIKLVFHVPDTSHWKIATQLPLLDSASNTYVAKNLQQLMDSPCVIADLVMREFKTGVDDKITIRLAINKANESQDLEQLMDIIKGMVAEQSAIYGELPEFDNNQYTFLCSYGPGYHGDGMEHRNSTMVSSSLPLQGNVSRLMGTISHEFFHVWNVERLRPSSLEPFDFVNYNVSGELWFAEGFTSYYGDLTLCRSGAMDARRYLNTIGRGINMYMNSPGWQFGSPVYMSEMASYTDGTYYGDEHNFTNTYLSYYNYGELIALALDMTLRTEFDDVSLDDLMRYIWVNYGKGEKTYSNEDIKGALAAITDDEDFANEYFEDYIYGNTAPNFVTLFDQFGYKLIKKNPQKASLGFVRMRFEGDTAMLVSTPLVGSALYEAGLNKGDLILSIDEQPVTSYPELNFIVGTRKVGDELEITYSHYGKLKNSSFKLKEDGQMVLIPKEQFSIRIQESETALRESWLGSKVE